MSPTEPLATDRLELEPLSEAHAAEMVAVLGHPGLYEFIGGEAPTLERLAIRYRTQVAGSGSDDEEWHNWIVRLGGAAVGFVQATVTGTACDIAWVIGVPWQRRGIATEAAERMCEWLLERGVERLDAHVHPEHVASQRVATALGLIETAEVDDEGETLWTRLVPRR